MEHLWLRVRRAHRNARGTGGPVNDTSRYLKNPALFADAGSVVGNSFVWVYAVHPDVDTVRITSGDYTKDLKVYEVDGAGYAPFEIPKNMRVHLRTSHRRTGCPRFT